MRSEKVEIEEIASTKSERLLAFVLGIFVLVGPIWAYDKIDNRYTHYGDPTLKSGLLEIVLTLALLSLGLVFLSVLRRRRSRYLPLSFAVIVPACMLALGFAGDYTNDYYGFADLGPLVLSLTGIALTLVAFFFLQRYLARRVPVRRVRKHECPFCGYPVRSGIHCEGCGREVIGECSSCGKERRAGTAFCASCGKA
ncbi:MAG: zinc ribbon domain-containing protein [Gaiellaceae bacterium]